MVVYNSTEQGVWRQPNPGVGSPTFLYLRRLHRFGSVARRSRATKNHCTTSLVARVILG